MDDYYIVYKCLQCNRHFVLFSNEVKFSEEESTYLTCSFNGKHNKICVVGRYDNLKDCTKHDSYTRKNGKVVQKGWG